MPVDVDFQLNLPEAGTLAFSLLEPTPVGGWSIQFTLWRRFGMPQSSGLVTKSVASGFNNVSGINITNSGTGALNVSFFPGEVSGLNPGAYAYQIARTDSGFQTELSKGFRLADW